MHLTPSIPFVRAGRQRKERRLTISLSVGFDMRMNALFHLVRNPTKGISISDVGNPIISHLY